MTLETTAYLLTLEKLGKRTKRNSKRFGVLLRENHATLLAEKEDGNIEVKFTIEDSFMKYQNGKGWYW